MPTSSNEPKKCLTCNKGIPNGQNYCSNECKDHFNKRSPLEHYYRAMHYPKNTK